MNFAWAKNILNKAEEMIKTLSMKAKIALLIILLVFMISGAVVAYLVYDYTQNDPKFCVTCHLMQPAFDTWALSAHKSLNCHDCHHLSIPEQNMLLVNFVLHRPTSVPERHGATIIASKFCAECHVDGNQKRGKAPMIKESLYHMKHIDKKIDCTQCHGEVLDDKSGLHRFLPTEKFCTKCHKGKQVHGEGMGKLACLNCHTERTKDLRPGRMKCLFCHGSDEKVRQKLREDATIDVKYFQPDQAIIKKADKITFSEKAPMQFYCYECHKPHIQGKVRPHNEDCLRCHKDVPKIGKHEVHLGMNMQCKDCHKQHLWTVTDASAKKACVQCHEYRGPKAFMQ